MGLIGQIMSVLFGDSRNAIVETAEVFRANAERSDQRAASFSEATLNQFAKEFAHPSKSWFDRLIDGLNRLPRPMMALGTLGLFVAAMSDPLWFADRMVGIQLIPEPLWWLMGAVVSFYFGARHQAKGQDFQRSVAQTLALRETLQPATSVTKESVEVAEPTSTEPLVQKSDNAALDDWRAGRD